MDRDQHDKINQTSELRDAEKCAPSTEPSDAEAVNGKTEPEQPYSIFSKREKRLITFIMSLTTLFPPLSASMYYPIITELAGDLNVSITKINLTITLYLIFQGLAPSFIGNFSDEVGRRPALVICFTIFISACIGLALKGSYTSLIITRCLQSSGSSGTIALAFATVSDIVTSAERGSYISYVQMGWMIGPAFGPLLGGVLSQYLGWQSIFWFLTIFGSAVLAACLVFLPETSRKIVGNGSIPPQRWNISLLAYLHLREQRKSHSITETRSEKGTARPNPLSSVKLFLDKESCIFLLYSGTIYTGQYMVLANLPAQLSEKYHLDTLHISLCFFATGAGIIASVSFVGRVLDWNFRRHAKRLGLEISKDKQQDLSDFPIELARMQVSLPLLLLSALAVSAYGWTLQARLPLAAPLIFVFLAQFGNAAAFSGFSGLIVDLNRERAGTATAAMNLARCWIGAGGVAAIGPMSDKLGIGWASMIIAAVWALGAPAVIWAVRCGPAWRAEKREKKTEVQAPAAE